MFPTPIRRFLSSRALLDGFKTPFKAKRTWPPDFEKLSQKHQFQLERRYRRRMQLKFARPNWMKATKIAQWGIISFVLVYAVLFLNWGENLVVFDRIRDWYKGLGQGIWTKRPDPEAQQQPKESVSPK